MSDMHVLDITNGVARVVMHFPVPTGNNAVGTPWVTVVLENAGFNEDGSPATPRTKLRTIDAVEKAEIEAGTIIEFTADIPGLVEATDAGRRSLVRTVYAAVKATKATQFQDRFQFYGHTESEA